MNTLPPLGSPERAFVVDRLLNDTGFFARYVLGMDTDRDEFGNCTSEIGKGGIRDHGPHQQCVSFLDDSTTHRVLWAPRASYKSSMLRAYIMRKICAHPNISILFYMQDDKMAASRCLEIREELVNNPILKELFPNMRGHLWKRDRFITGLRYDKAGDTPTLYSASPRTIPVGTRPHEVLWDDIVTENDLGDTGLERGRRCVERSLPLGARGCRYTFVGTPKHFADAGHWLCDLPGWNKLITLDVGFDLKVNDDKSLSLTGKARWPHLDRARLEPLLRGGVSFQTFMSEYMLKVVSGSHQAFHRHHFQVVKWQESMQDLTGYLLTDVAQGTPEGATSGEKGAGALNVLLYVGVDERQKLYILDCEIGRWDMHEFCMRYLNMVDRWSGKVNHRAEIMEQVHSNTGYASFLALKAKERNRRTQICWQRRTTGDLNKDSRIAGLSGRFQAMSVYVCNDTMPRTWVADAEVRTLWDPEGYSDPNGKGVRLPSGDFVEQFIRWPYHGLKDIPDAASLANSMDKDTGQLVCFWMKPVRLRLAEQDQRQAAATSQSGTSTRFYERIRKQRRR